MKDRLKNIICATLTTRIIYECFAMWWRLGYVPNIFRPTTFNEKIVHQKIFMESPLAVWVADKWAVRDYVSAKIGPKYLNEIYAVTDDPPSVCYEALPSCFVAKATHGSGWNIFVHEKSDLIWADFTSELQTLLKRKWPRHYGENWYRKIPSKIIFERFLEDDKHFYPLDYKFFVFSGKTRFIAVDFNRFDKHTRTLYSRDWKKEAFSFEFKDGKDIPRPRKLDEMVEVAEVLASDFDFVRVDLYSPNEASVVFGELTLSPSKGRGRFCPVAYDTVIGREWKVTERMSSEAGRRGHL